MWCTSREAYCAGGHVVCWYVCVMTSVRTVGGRMGRGVLESVVPYSVTLENLRMGCGKREGDLVFTSVSFVDEMVVVVVRWEWLSDSWVLLAI